MTRVLLIVDMQKVLMPVIWHADELAVRIAAVARAARARDVPVVAVQQTGPVRSPFDPDTPGWQLSERLDIEDGDLRVRKSATDSFFATGLGDLLFANNVDTIILTGVATDYCVDATARSALSRGLNVDLVSDGHAPATRGDPAGGLSPQQIIDHHNTILSRAIHPGGRLRLVSATEVFDDADGVASP